MIIRHCKRLTQMILVLKIIKIGRLDRVRMLASNGKIINWPSEFKQPFSRTWYALTQLLSTHCRESNLLKRIFQCCLLNGGFFGFSIVLFECALLPVIRLFLNWMFGHNPGVGVVVGGWIVTLLSIIFGMIWILPLFVLSKIVNSLWFQVILFCSKSTSDMPRFTANQKMIKLFIFCTIL